MKQTILVLFLLAAPLSAQLHFGVKGGIPFTDALSTNAPFESRFANWTLGPMIDLDLPLGLGVEFDALYRKSGLLGLRNEDTGSSWSFPLVAKYRFPGAVVRPYVLGGFVYRHISNVGSVFDGTGDGLVLGTGIRFNAFVFKISPELRYTRWSGPKNTFTEVRPNQNQFELLVGITF